MDSNKKKNEQLGMPYGTAQGRLRKKLLFSYVQKCGDDTCYRCGEKIEDINNFSIEHKIPWLDSSIDLFWDLDNIAFSHLSCNIGNARWTKERAKYKTIVCHYCGREFERVENNIKAHIKKGYKNTYCSLSCTAKGEEPWKYKNH